MTQDSAVKTHLIS